MLKSLAVAIGVFVGSTLAAAQAVHGPPDPAADASQESDLSDDWVRRISPWHRDVTRWIDNTARGVDSFFGTDDAWRTDNESYLRLRAELRWDELESWNDSDLDHKFRLDLPTAKERLRLVFESDPDRDDRGIENTLPRRSDAPRDGRGSLLGLGALSRERDPRAGWVNRVQGGVRARFPIDPYLRFTTKRVFDLAGDWDLNLDHKAEWFNSDGYSLDNRIDFARPLSPDWLLRVTTDAIWEEEVDKLFFAQSVTLAHVLSRRSAINYSAGITAESLHEMRDTNYFLVAHYRRDVHKKLLYFDAIPELTFPREEDFEPVFGITLRLELYFRDTF